MENLSYKLLQELSNNPEKVLDLDPKDFENLQNYVFLAGQVKEKCLKIGIHV
jgi:hypothetical protein